jgi:CHAT domain-containing protein
MSWGNPFDWIIQEAVGAAEYYFSTGNVQALDASVAAWEAVVEHPSFSFAPSSVRMRVLDSLGKMLLERYDASADAADLERAIQAHEAAADGTPADSADLPGYLNNLGIGVLERYKLTGDGRDVVRAIDIGERAVALEPSAPENVSSLGSAFWARYGRDGDPADLERVIESYETAVALTPADSPRLGLRLSHLGNGLSDRYKQTRNLEDLNRAIEAYQSSVKKTPQRSPRRPLALGNLGAGLLDRYEHTGDLRDLTRAIDSHEQALAEAPPGALLRPLYLTNLGIVLRLLHDHTGQRRHLDRALEVLEEAAKLAPPGSPKRLDLLDNLGNGLATRYEETEDPRDLDRAIEISEEVLATAPPNSPGEPNYLTNMGSRLARRYGLTKNREDIDRAIELTEAAVAKTPAGLPDLSGRLNNLAICLHDRWEQTRDRGDLERAVDTYRSSCIRGLEAGASNALMAARGWAGWATSRASWQEVIDACQFGLEATSRIVHIQIWRLTKEPWLRKAQLLSEYGAYAAAMLDDREAAVTILERGQAQLLSSALERDRADLAALQEEGRSDLHNRYIKAAGRLSELEATEFDAGQAATSSQRAGADAIRAAQAELDATISSIREVPGYENFLSPLAFEDVVAITATAPLAYLATTEAGGLALIVTGHNVIRAWLPGLTEKTLDSRLRSYFDAYERWRDHHDTHAATWSAALDELTRWLWDAAMEPLLNALPSSPPTAQLTLAPAGLLGLLPLHAAWTEDSTTPTGRRYALDEVLLTYAPNARAVQEAHRLAARTPASTLLAVEEPRPVTGPPLYSAAHETASALALFAPSVKHLAHEHATRKAVIPALAEAAVLHLACHGYADLNAPLDSGLAMAGDELITLQDLFALRLQARLAVLSACETALPGTTLPNEAVSLPTGLLQAGVAGVIASFWTTADLRTLLLMVGFYERWRRQELAPPEALRQAQRWLRDSTNGDMRALFKTLLAANQAGWPPKLVVQACYEAVVLKDPAARSFAAPVNWADFAYVGV